MNNNDDYKRYDQIVKSVLKRAGRDDNDNRTILAMRSQLITHIDNYLYSQLNREQLQRVIELIEKSASDDDILDYLESVGIDVVASEDVAMADFTNQYLAKLKPQSKDEKFMGLFKARRTQNA